MEFLEISQNSKNTSFTEHLWAIASEMLKNLMILKKLTLLVQVTSINFET